MPSKDQWKAVGKIVAIILGVLLLLWLLPELIGGAAYSYYYSHFFQTLTNEGDMNPWLATAISILFATTIGLGATMFVKGLVFIKSRQARRFVGAFVLVGASVAFHLLMYACTSERGPKLYYARKPTGEIEMYPSRRHPVTDERLEPVTVEVLREHEGQKRREQELAQQLAQRKAADKLKQDKVDAEEREKQARRLFQDSNSNQTVISSLPADALVLAVKSDASDSQGVEGLLADLLRKKKKSPVSGVFKSAFYTSGLFDKVWTGDQDVLKSLRLFDRGPVRVLLCRPYFSAASPTDFPGIVSVQGSLSLILVTEEGRSGTRVFREAGVGGDGATAAAQCATRLVEAIDLDVLFRK